MFAMMLRMTAAVSAMHAVVEKVEKRAQGQKEVGKEPKKVGPVFGE